MTKVIIIDGQETIYIISENGEIYNTKTKKFLKGTYKRNEYHTVQLTVNGKIKSYMTHRLVAEAFLPNPNQLSIVHHIDHNKHNNNVNNLQWVTIEENAETNTNKRKGEKIFIEPDEIIWKILPLCNDYLISKEGVLYNRIRKRITLGSIRNGYVRVEIKGTAYSIHRLVYETFVGPIPKGMVIDHINGIKDDNRLENLRCISQSENAINAQKNGHRGQHKVAQYDINNNFIKEYPSFTAAAKEFNVSYAAISSAAKRDGTSCGYKWKEL